MHNFVIRNMNGTLFPKDIKGQINYTVMTASVTPLK